MLKPPSAIRSESLGAVSRFSRMYCAHCHGDELHHSMVCVQCKRGGIPVVIDPVKPLSALTVRKRYNP